MPKREEKTIAKNRRAFHDYEILETYEAGIELTGTEVRSLRENNCQLTDCFALIRNGEVWLNNVHISPYSNGSIFNPDPDRRRKLLLHKKQIRYLDAKVAEKGLAIVPLKMYFNEDGREGGAGAGPGQEALRQARLHEGARHQARDRPRAEGARSLGRGLRGCAARRRPIAPPPSLGVRGLHDWRRALARSRSVNETAREGHGAGSRGIIDSAGEVARARTSRG